MCAGNVPSRRRPGEPRPRWSSLYGLAAAFASAVTAVTLLTAEGPSRDALLAGLSLAGFGSIGAWVRRNAAALEVQDWCPCASRTVAMRVVRPRRRRPQAFPVPPAHPAGPPAAGRPGRAGLVPGATLRA